MAVVLSVGGCETVVFSGRTGVSVDASGNPVVVLAVCNGFIDAITVYTERAEGTRTVGAFRTSTPVTRE